MTKDEIIKLAESVGINFQEHIGVLGRSNITTLGSQPIGKIEAFARACYEAGKAEFAKGAKVTIPPHAMEQEFQLHYRKGYEAGRTAEREECAKVCDSISQDQWSLYKGRPPYTRQRLHAGKVSRCRRLRRSHPSKGEAVTKETDRELLELAAKAAGIDLAGWSEYRSAFWLGGSVVNQLMPWNPLTDDGDALRLAVKLRIAIRIDDPDAVCAGWCANQNGAPTLDGKGPWFWKEWIDGEANNNGDPNAAIRRAIVRAAAEIGRAMP
jgi:hypothetical protein